MPKQSFEQDHKKPIDYFKEVEAAKKLEKTNAESLVVALRSDMLPASSTSPASKNIFQRLNFKIIGGALVGLVIFGLIWAALLGPGRPILEQRLAGLIHISVTPTEQATLTPIPPTKTPAQLARLPTKSPTARPTYTPTIKITASATLPAETSTPTFTPTQGCRDAVSITLQDVGKTLCVQGKVVEIIDLPNEFMLIFSYERGAFYWVSYDLVWSQAKVNACYQITGKIRQISHSPILVFDYQNIPEECP
jgi:hypothetical protein